MELRPAVQKFAEAMERKLRTHDKDRGEDGWQNADPESLFGRLKEETVELEMALRRDGRLESLESQAEAVDVANFAMMIWDVCS